MAWQDGGVELMTGAEEVGTYVKLWYHSRFGACTVRNVQRLRAGESGLISPHALGLFSQV